MTPTSDSAELFRNLIPCDSFDYPFVDDYSQFGVVFDRGRPLGPGQLQVRSSVLYQQAADALLTLWAEDVDGTWVPVTRRSAEHLPWLVTERGGLPGLEVEARHIYVDERRLLSEFRLSAFRAPADRGGPDRPASAGAADDSSDGAARAPRALPRLQFRGQLAEDEARHAATLKRFGLADPPRRANWAVAGAPAGHASLGAAEITAGLDSDARDEYGRKLLPGAAVRVVSLACAPKAGRAGEPSAETTAYVSDAPPWGAPTPGLEAGPIYYRFEVVARTSDLRITFLSELSATSYRSADYEWRGAEGIDLDSASGDAFDRLVASARERFTLRIALDRPPEVTPLRSDRAWRARWALLRTGYRGTSPAGEFGDLVASTCVPSCGGFTRAFFWDAFFTAAALARFEPQYAKTAVLAQFVRQLPDGHCPEHVFNYNVAGRSAIGAPQAPVASWAVREILSVSDDEAYLQRVYPLLATNHRYWECCGDRDGDGLAEWTWSGQTSDSGPIWDEYRNDDAHSNWVPPVASVQLNAFLYRDALILAELARRLGRAEEEEHYRARADGIYAAVMEHLYVPAERRFWDYYPATRRHTRIRTFYMFWPIWAGMPVPPEAKADLIENELLNSEHFFGTVPFPSVAYSEPSYENLRRGRFWRGTTWPHVTYWLLQLLVREGYESEADAAAARFLAVYDREPSFPEHIASDPRHYAAGGSADYNWGVAAYLLIAERSYREQT